MDDIAQQTYINRPKVAVLVEYVKNHSNAKFSIVTEHYAIGYIIHGNCRIHSDSNCFDIPEQCLYVLERGRHIIENKTDCNGLFEQVVMHLDRDEVTSQYGSDDENRRLESVVIGAVAENLTLDELAERCYVSEATVRNWMAKKLIPAAKVHIIREMVKELPLVMPGRVQVEEETKITLSLDAATRAALEKRAFAQGKTLSEFLADEVPRLGN